jgi:hypothetical protein
MPWFEELSKRYPGSGLTFLGLSTDIDGETASPEKVGATVKRLGVTYPMLLDDGSLKATYGPVHLLPETFYINRKGVIVEDVWGHTDKETINRNIKKIIRWWIKYEAHREAELEDIGIGFGVDVLALVVRKPTACCGPTLHGRTEAPDLKTDPGDEVPNRKLTVHHGDSETGEHDLKEAIAAGINPIPRKY